MGVSDAQARFQNAILNARQLPPDLLTNSQKLKLYALYKQTEQPAPEDPPPRVNPLARAKWEAWNDVRSLSEQQAMESYCAIIEGLVSMMTETGALPSDPLPPQQQATRLPPVQPTSRPESAPARPPPPPPPLAGDEPVVECTTWSTSALTVAPGSSVDVPLDASEPSLCTYTFSTTDGSAVGVTISYYMGDDEPLLTLRQPSGEGNLVVQRTGLLRVVVDNSQAMFVPLTVACKVSLEPLSQLRRLEEFTLRASLRSELALNERQIEATSQQQETLRQEEKALVAQLGALQAQVAQVQRALARKGSETVQSERRKMELVGEQASLKLQLRKTLWAVPRSWREALPKA